MSDFGFVGPSYPAQSIYQDAQDCINWYPEVDPVKGEGDRGVVALYPTPGLLPIAQLPQNSPCRGLWVLPGGATMLAVVGNALYSCNSNFAFTFVGNLSTSVNPVSITDNGTSAYITDGISRYYYTWGTSTFAAISDGAFTGGDQCSYVDEYIIYNNPNTQQWGCTNALSVSSNALNFASADSTSDNIVTVFADHREVKILKEKSSEVWANAGLFPFPFQRIPGTNTQHGCLSKYSVARFGESIAWLSKDDRGQGIVVMFKGYIPTRISNHAVENDIASGVLTDAIAFTYQDSGHEFYVLSLPTQDKTWVFDLATGQWHKRAWMDSMGKLHRIRPNVCAVFQNKIVVGDWQNGTLYQYSRAYYTDNGYPIPRIRRAVHLTNDLKRVFHRDLQIQFQPGVGIPSGQGSNPQAMLKWSNDGGQTWSSERWTSIGKQGKYTNRAIWRRLGQARDRVYEIRVTDPINAVVVSANLNVDGGSS